MYMYKECIIIMYEQTYILVYFGNVIDILGSGFKNMKNENVLKCMYFTIKPNSKKKTILY